MKKLLVAYPIGNRSVLVTPADAERMNNDMFLYGFLCVTQAPGGECFERIKPEDVTIRPPTGADNTVSGEAPARKMP